MPERSSSLAAHAAHPSTGSDPCGHRMQLMPRAPPGVYTQFEDFVPHLTEAQLRLTRAHYPPLPPSVLPACKCGAKHTLAEQMETEGAIHGDRILGRMLIARWEAGAPPWRFVLAFARVPVARARARACAHSARAPRGARRNARDQCLPSQPAYGASRRGIQLLTLCRQQRARRGEAESLGRGACLQ